MKLWRTPLDVDKFTTPHGDVHIISARCKGCKLCVEYCPRDVLAVSDEMNEKGYHPPIAVAPERCVVCRLCELLCPEFCIYTVKAEEEAEEGAPSSDPPARRGEKAVGAGEQVQHE